MVGVDVKGILLCDKSGLTLIGNLKKFFLSIINYSFFIKVKMFHTLLDQ